MQAFMDHSDCQLSTEISDSTCPSRVWTGMGHEILHQAHLKTLKDIILLKCKEKLMHISDSCIYLTFYIPCIWKVADQWCTSRASDDALVVHLMVHEHC